MNRIILLATHNLHKIKEIKAILEDFHIETTSLIDYPNLPEIEEDGQTFAENALKKARAISAFSGFTCLADDSGLLVEALGGEPGIHSARYAGIGAGDQDNNDKLLTKLKGQTNRKARFQCVLALVTTDGREHLFYGTVEGSIALSSQGKRGFGYDSLFIPAGYNQTFGVLAEDVKKNISHRARALCALVDFLQQNDDFMSY